MFISEVIRPVSAKLVQLIQGWRYVELEDLLQSQQKDPEDLPNHQEGVVLFQLVESAKKKRTKITDLADWMEAFAVFFVAVLSKSDPVVVPYMMAYMVQIKEAQTTWGEATGCCMVGTSGKGRRPRS